MKKLLLHTCCACCSTEVIERLKKEYDITLFFSNSNIYPIEEYEKRLEEAKKIAEIMELDLVEDEYLSLEWEMFVGGLENYKKMPEGGRRCELCFKFNLTRTAKFAKDFKFDLFTTTLTISPHKDHEMINKIGEKISKRYNVNFLKSNFKENNGFNKSLEHSKKHKLYRQNYCGCKYSKRK
ncbi:epoxyqueuosine reductase QueH [Candidatus Woesearchaeota archaeon]|jgi:epoxyqueuosine reductase|nr:epoxyqueuosine reductase QueH [Candidatus Woesearchaeota archaeon]MBT5272502.1 epoxyqueuosine reductase QueH [Candidatus Woesearchaeota archaeon]MBT6041490.1 epoxyqueuosine reductase QueH [Candidatus Woesearchaeota archaeon]MBT6336364.1 epoxyqueuosine reductase QueH [Candidatus Woesearchaeota archaeon]MBT7928266.1 epoxyqueuosine reductase QueH [Candidatus Woesearchaeota archaeon]